MPIFALPAKTLPKIKFFVLTILFFLLAQFFAFFFKEKQINHRMIFGLIGTNSSALIICILSVALIFFLLIYKKKFSISVALILAGAISNLTDRIVYSGVRDYFKIGWWPAFNMADIFIVAGLMLFFIQFLNSQNHNSNRK